MGTIEEIKDACSYIVKLYTWHNKCYIKEWIRNNVYCISFSYKGSELLWCLSTNTIKLSNFITSKAIMLLFRIGPVKWMWKLSAETFKRSIKFQLSSGFYVFTNVAKHLT